MNDVVLRKGVQFPYDMEELYTSLIFQESAMHLMLEVEKGYEHFLEDTYFYEEYENPDWDDLFFW